MYDVQVFTLLFSHSVMSNSLQPHGLQHARLPRPSPSPGACSNSCLLSQWCHPTSSSSVVPFSSCLQSFPASGSFPMSQLFTLGGQSVGASASVSVLPMNIQDWFSFRIDWFDLLAVQGTLKSLPHHHSSKASILCCPVFFMVLLSHQYMTSGKTIALTRWTFVSTLSLPLVLPNVPYKASNPIIQDPILKFSSKSSYLTKASVPNTITLEGSVSLLLEDKWLSAMF